jgi:hypothetical protein
MKRLDSYKDCINAAREMANHVLKMQGKEPFPDDYIPESVLETEGFFGKPLNQKPDDVPKPEDKSG